MSSQAYFHASFFPQWLVTYFSRLTTEQSMAYMQKMLCINIHQNLQVVIQITAMYSDILSAVKLIEMFETFEGEPYASRVQHMHIHILQQVSTTASVPSSTSAKVQKSISSISRPQLVPVKLGKSSAFATSTTPRKSRTTSRRQSFQISFRSSSSVIGSISFMTLFSTYTRMVSPSSSRCMCSETTLRTPQVVGGLLDIDCDETMINSLLVSMMGNFPIDELVHEVEQGNRLKLILPWLENRLQSGSQDPAVFNAMAKIYIDGNSNPEVFLKENNVSNLKLA
jgi:clathrin heavy chain